MDHALGLKGIAHCIGIFYGCGADLFHRALDRTNFDLEVEMSGGWKRVLSNLLIQSALLAGVFPAAAQFVAPPPPPPLLPPNFGQQQFQQQFQQQRQAGYRCATQFGICMLNAPGPLGFQCTCAVPGGFIPGQIIP